MIEYSEAPDVRQTALDIIKTLDLGHIDKSRVHFLRSRGSESRGVVARVHSLGRIWECSIGVRPSYTIEVISEKFDRMSSEAQVETIIHELLHIPHSFGGGFRHHRGYVTPRHVRQLSIQYQKNRMISR